MLHRITAIVQVAEPVRLRHVNEVVRRFLPLLVCVFLHQGKIQG